MAVLLDTAAVPRQNRAELVDAALRYATLPHDVTHEDVSAVHGRIDLWDFGAASLMRQHGSGIRMNRTATQLRTSAPERISLSLLTRGRWAYSQRDYSQTVTSGQAQLVLTDLTSAFDYDRRGVGGSHSLLVDVDQLNLPVDVIRTAAGRLPSSPLYDLVRDHVAGLSKVADVLTSAERAMVGRGTTELVRALIASAAQGEADAREAMTTSLMTRVTMYLHRHLTEPDLSPARIAREHNISVRWLYDNWTDELSVVQWIIRERLELARRELAGPKTQSIATVGRQCGFTDPAHFSRRFREAYGMPPREWRRLSQGRSGAR